MDTQQEFIKELGLNETAMPCSNGISWFGSQTKKLVSDSPVDGKIIGSVGMANSEDYRQIVETAQRQTKWATTPAKER